MKYWILILIVLSVVSTSCSNFTKNNKPMKATTENSMSQSINGNCSPNNNEKAMTINGNTVETIKKAIVEGINHDIWYNGKDSDYFYFQNRELGIEIYPDERNIPLFYILFTDKMKTPREKSQDEKYAQYYTITLGKNNGGFSADEMGGSSSGNIDELRKSLTTPGKLCLKDKVLFPEVHRPTFSADDAARESNINTIKSELQRLLDDGGFDKGIYNANIVNYNKYDAKIYMIFENDKKTWVISFSNLNNDISFFKVLNVDLMLKYEIEQFRKDIISKFTVEAK